MTGRIGEADGINIYQRMSLCITLVVALLPRALAVSGWVILFFVRSMLVTQHSYNYKIHLYFIYDVNVRRFSNTISTNHAS